MKGLLADFLVIGAQRCGTTSMYEYLTKHPDILPASEKEIHFFDIHFEKGIKWYESCFSIFNDANSNKKITGEASPYYIFHPLVPMRVHQTIPNAKLIVLLRNPVDRAYSHYDHEVRLGAETLSFEDAIKNEEKRLEVDKNLVLEGKYSFNHQHYSYLSRGVYVNQLKKWMSIFPKNQFKIIGSEDFFSNPAQILKQVFYFLNLPERALEKYETHNQGIYSKINDKTRRNLEEYFKPYNEELFSFLGMNFNW